VKKERARNRKTKYCGQKEEIRYFSSIDPRQIEKIPDEENEVTTSQKPHCASITKIRRFCCFKEKTSLQHESYETHKYTVCEMKRF
jgi:hypothetical protein